jgi:nucleotide-binding universal stress UspA family protein
MKRILAGIDGSSEATHAAQQAADLARATGAQLALVYVVPRRPPPGPETYVTNDEERREVIEHGYAAALLRDHELLCRRDGLSIDTETRTGPIAETLADVAEAGKYDLIVVGHRGRGAVTRALLGSVADRLVQISRHPVLVVR